MEVDIDHPLRRQIVLVDEPAERHDPGVVDEHIQGAELLLGAVQERRKRIPVGHIQREGHRVGGAPNLLGGLLGGAEVHVADRHLHPLAQERLRGGPADAACTTGDRSGLTGEDARLLGHQPGH